MLLPDINVWIALAFRSHRHHSEANSWWSAIGHVPVAFCRATQQGFLRLANNPKALADAVRADRAWQLYDTLLSESRVQFVEEPSGLEATWRTFTCGRDFSPKLWNGAYLAAFALLTGYEIVTFDRGFAQFTHVKSTILA